MSEVVQALSAALRLDVAHFSQVSIVTALWVALLAGLSTMLGHIAILLLNRIRGWRLITTMVLNFVSLAFLHVVQAAVIWAMVSAALLRPVALLPLILVGLLSLAPQVFAFLQAMPHFGLFLGRVLQGWSFLILWFGVGAVFGLGRWSALGLSLTGWVVMQLLSRLLQRPLSWLSAQLWSIATGRPALVTSRDVLAGMPFMPVLDRTRREVKA